MEPTKSETPKVQPEPQVIRQVTENDAYIQDLITAGPKTVDEIQVKDYKENSGRHRLALPIQIEQKYGKKYAFRWVNKKKQAVDHAVFNRRWNIVNRMLFSDMPKVLFTANGTIENGDLILCFMPMAEAERLRRAPGELSRQRVKDLPMEKWKNSGEDSPFYKPTLGQEEKDGETVQTGIQPDLQPNE